MIERPRTLHSFMTRQRPILLLLLNGGVIYIFILFRIHYISEGIHDLTRQDFPVSKTVTDVFKEVNQFGRYAEKLAKDSAEEMLEELGEEVLGLIKENPAEAVTNRPTSAFNTTSPPPIEENPPREKNHTALDKQIEKLNKRLQNIAINANVSDPRDLGLEFIDDHHDGRPAFHEIVTEAGKIKGDVSDLLQFAIIGYVQCGIDTVADWIAAHPRMQVFPEESMDLMKSDPVALLARMYALPSGNFQRGYKSASDASMPHITKQIAELFPKTKLIVGIRHPIRWFEALYNFRLQNWNPALHSESFPYPNDLIGKCYANSYNTCTGKGEFGNFLRNSGLTRTANFSKDDDLSSPNTELALIAKFEREMHRIAGMKYSKVTSIPNPVFLYEYSQLDEGQDREAKEAFRESVAEFLGIASNQPLSLNIPESQPLTKSWDPQVQAEKDATKIDICEEEYITVRYALLQQSRMTAIWIRRVLLPTGRVRTSDPVLFDRLLDQWMVDPCGPDEETDMAGVEILQILGVELDDALVPAALVDDDHLQQ